MTDTISWMHFKQIIGEIDRIKAAIKKIARDIDKLRVIKEEILDNTELKAELKKIIDVYPETTMENIIEDYTKFQALRNWLEENNYI